MLDIVLGTVDWEYFEDLLLIPERQLWCDCEVGWVKKSAIEGAEDLDRYPGYEVDEMV